MTDGAPLDYKLLAARWRDTPTERDTLLAEAGRIENGAGALVEAGRALLSADPDAACALAEIGGALAAHRGEPEIESAAHRLAAQAMRIGGRHEEAITSFQAAAAIARRAANHVLAAEVQIGIVDSMGILGRIDEAILFAHALETALDGLGATEQLAKLLVNVGGLYFRRDAYLEALDCYRQAEEIFTAKGDRPALARVKTNSANALLYLDRIGDAMTQYEEARAYFESQGMALEAAVVDSNLGYWYTVSAKYVHAVDSFTRSLAVFQHYDRPQDTALAQLGRAEAFRSLNLFEESLSDYSRAIVLLESRGLNFDLARAHFGRASALAAQEHNDAASESLDHADALFRDQNNTVRRAFVDLLRATLLTRKGATAEAMIVARRAARVFSRRKLAGWAAEARLVLALGLPDLDSLPGLRTVARTARRLNRGWLECRAEQAMGRAHLRLGDRNRARAHMRRSVAALESSTALISLEEMYVSFLRDKISVHEDLIAILLEDGGAGDLEEAFLLIERSRSRALLERVHATIDERGPVSSAATEYERVLIGRLADLRARLARAYGATDALDEANARRLADPTRTSDARALADLERRYRDALREVELCSAPRRFRMSPPRLQAVQAALMDGEVLLEYQFVGQSLVAFVIRRDGVCVRRYLARRDQIVSAARRLRYHLDRASAAAYMIGITADMLQTGIDGVLALLYDLLLRPLEADLSCERIVLAPHDLLHGLPFHAFHDGRSYALDRWEFVVAPSASVWMEAPRPGGPAEWKPALLVGVSGEGLEHVAAEIESLADLLPDSTRLVGDAATLDAFRAEASGRQLIHLAMHANYRTDNPLFSGLRFRDDWLLARDLYSMTLNCELATLSACRTAEARIDAGDEIFGLVRGFLISGCQAVAASLWPADDVATAHLMVRFYQELWKGQSLAAALRIAQRETREGYPNPYHWGAFILVGNRVTRSSLPVRSADQLSRAGP